MHVVEGISDRVVALDHGVKIAEGTFERGRDEPARRRGVPRDGRDGAQVSDAAERHRAPAEARGHQHLLRPDPHPHRLEPAGRRGRARLPARRQRVGEVDDAEDDPRARAAAHGDGDVRRRGRDEHADVAPDQARPRDRAREPPPVRADDRAREPRDGVVPAAEGGSRGGVRAGLRALPAALRAPRRSSPGRSRAASSRWSRWDAR